MKGKQENGNALLVLKAKVFDILTRQQALRNEIEQLEGVKARLVNEINRTEKEGEK